MGDGSADAFAINYDTASAQYEFTNSAATDPIPPVPVGQLDGILIDGGGGHDTLTVTGTTASVPVTMLADPSAGGTTLDVSLGSGAELDDAAQTLTLGTLSLAQNSTFRIDPDGTRLLYLTGLSVDTTTVNGQPYYPATLDVEDNDVIIHTPSPAAAAATEAIVTAMGQQAYDEGSCDGQGLSSAIAGTANREFSFATALGNTINANSDGTVADKLWHGTPVGPNDVLIRYTYYGDTNLDGVVDNVDVDNTDRGETDHLTGWANGDFNYNGRVDASDFTILDNGYNYGGDPTVTLDENGTCTVSFYQSNLDDGGGQDWDNGVSAWTVRWGDGTSNTYTVPADDEIGDLVDYTHTYPSPNADGYVISATATDAYGTDTFEIPHLEADVTPTPPSDLVATEGNPNEVDLSWADDSAISSGYVVYDSTDGTDFTQLAEVPAGTFGYAATGLTPCQPYTFRVVADNHGVVQSADSNTITAVATAGIVSATGPATINEGTPATLTLASDASDTVRSWQVIWTDASGAQVGSNTFTGANVTTATPNASTAELEADVLCWDATGTEFVLPIVFADTVPTPPTNLTVTAPSPAEADLTWTDASATVDDFQILRSDDGGSFAAIADVDPGTFAYSDTTVTAGETATYEVAALGPTAAATAAPATSAPTVVPVTYPGVAPQTLTLTATVDPSDRRWPTCVGRTKVRTTAASNPRWKT